MKQTYHLTEQIWLYPGKAGWYFITLPKEVAKDIDFYFSLHKKGWGSLPVTVTIGKTEWQTSIFPDKKSESYLLPVKAEVRKREAIRENDLVQFVLEVSD